MQNIVCFAMQNYHTILYNTVLYEIKFEEEKYVHKTNKFNVKIIHFII